MEKMMCKAVSFNHKIFTAIGLLIIVMAEVITAHTFTLAAHLSNFDERFDMTGFGQLNTEFIKAFAINPMCQLYYVSAYTTDSAGITTVNVRYSQSVRESEEVNDYLNSYVSTLDKNSSKEDNLDSFVDYCKDTFSYDNSKECITDYDLIENNKGVCQSYALLLYRFANKINVPCRIVTGKFNEEDHAWNQIFLNGVWKTVDLTSAVEGEDFFIKNDSNYSVSGLSKSIIRMRSWFTFLNFLPIVIMIILVLQMIKRRKEKYLMSS